MKVCVLLVSSVIPNRTNGKADEKQEMQASEFLSELCWSCLIMIRASTCTAHSPVHRVYLQLTGTRSSCLHQVGHHIVQSIYYSFSVSAETAVRASACQSVGSSERRLVSATYRGWEVLKSRLSGDSLSRPNLRWRRSRSRPGINKITYWPIRSLRVQV